MKMLAEAQWGLEQASQYAGRLDLLWNFLVWISVFATCLVFGVVVYFSVRYRRTATHTESTPVHGNTKLEIIWSIIPLILMLGAFVWGAKLYFDVSRAPKDAMNIYAVGKQWMWKMQHPSGKREINHLHIPVGRPIKISITSEDVIHSFFVPAFRVKMDAVPGRFTSVWFTADKTGEYHLFCAEYCGTEHSLMTGRVIVMEKDAYEHWANDSLDVQATLSMAERGKLVFDKMGCIKCHGGGVPGMPQLGATLEGAFGHEVELTTGEKVIVDENYIRESVLYPGAKIVKGFMNFMPSFKELISEEELSQLIEYIKSLPVKTDSDA